MKTISLFFLAIGLATAEPSLTIYNNNFAVLRQEVPVKLDDGISEVSFSGVTAQVWPDSVVLRDPEGKAEFQILEQNYRNDPISQHLLLKQFEGKEINFEITHGDKVTEEKGKVIRSGYVPGGRFTEPVIDMGGQVRFGLPGKPLFPDLGEGNILEPTLTWRMQSEGLKNFSAQLSYLTGGFSWSAAYNVVAPEKGETIDITGWVTLKNHSGATFENAHIKLMAGEVNVVKPRQAQEGMIAYDAPMAMARSGERKMTQKAFDGFHLYSVGFPVTTRNQETKQVELLRASGVKAERKFIFDPQSKSRDKVGIFWEFKNEKERGLGMPFPAGTIRIYRKDNDDGNLEFVGSDRIDHTPKDEEIKVYTGNAFDLVAEEKVLSSQGGGKGRDRWLRQAREITLKNRSEETAKIEAISNLQGFPNMRIEKSSHKHKTEIKNSYHQKIVFESELKANEEKKITYTVYLHN